MFKDKQLRKEFEELVRRLFGEHVYRANYPLIGSINQNIANFEKELGSIHPCFNCKALFREEDLQRVKENLSIGIPENPKRWKDWGIVNHFYCPSHKVPYDRIQDGKYYKDNVLVDLKGKEIK